MRSRAKLPAVGFMVVATLASRNRAAVVSAESMLPKSNKILHFVGTRNRTFGNASDASYPKPYDDHYALIDDETVKRSGMSQQRVDDIRFEPIGRPGEAPWRDAERRVRDESVAGESRRASILVTKQSVA